MSPFITQTYLLGGLYQCVEMIHKIATTGQCSYQDYKHILMALNISKFISIADTFGDNNHLKNGLIACEKYFSMSADESNYVATIQINRYFTELFRLEATMTKQPSVMSNIAEQVKLNAEKFNEVDKNIESLIANFANIYAEQISPNAARIMIKGTENHLKVEFNAQKVRALLLSGLRIVLLWRECGGKQWHLFLKRKKIIQTCHQLHTKMS